MKKLHLATILLLICSVIACKKETINNPDIAEATINETIEAAFPTLVDFADINIDGEVLQDFMIVVSHPDDLATQHSIQLSMYDSKYQFLIQTVSDADVIKKIDKNSIIEPSLMKWKDGTVFIYHHLDNGTHYGSSDIGDQYFAFRKKNSGGGYFYGWMKVNISNNGEKIVIKEYAINTIADTPIKAGEI